MLKFALYIALVNTCISTQDYIYLMFKPPIYITIIIKLHQVITEEGL